MSQIYELFGYPLTDESAEAISHRKNALCPFMEAACDGGGNRYLSSLKVADHQELAEYFDIEGTVPSGVCSLQLHDGEDPWIVCPRRLLALKRGAEGPSKHQSAAEEVVLRLTEIPPGAALGVWAEVKIKEKITDDPEFRDPTFDYTFDYVISRLEPKSVEEVAQACGETKRQVMKKAEKAGYSFALREGAEFIEDCPSGPPTIVEVMTSSTSGGNKKKRTQIAMAFEDAILGKEHKGPGINYRQVWARMVSQLIVKSEVGIRWGGKTLWVLQDKLAEYISTTTGLDVRKFLAEHTSEVNMVAFSYGDIEAEPRGPIHLDEHALYAGPIAPDDEHAIGSAFQDIIRASASPPIGRLHKTLLGKTPVKRMLVSGSSS